MEGGELREIEIIELNRATSTWKEVTSMVFKALVMHFPFCIIYGYDFDIECRFSIYTLAKFSEITYIEQCSQGTVERFRSLGSDKACRCLSAECKLVQH